MYSLHISEMTNGWHSDQTCSCKPCLCGLKAPFDSFISHFLIVWFPRFLAFSGQSESQLAVRGSQEKVSMSDKQQTAGRSTMTHRHAALTHRPRQPPLVAQALLAVRWEGVLWIVFAPGGHGCWAMSGQRNELGGHILPWPRCCWLCAAFVCAAGESTACLPRCTPCSSARWFNIHTVWLNISQLTL